MQAKQKNMHFLKIQAVQTAKNFDSGMMDYKTNILHLSSIYAIY